MMKSIRRGDIILVRFPAADLIAVKKRPALVVQADGLNKDLPDIVIAKITSQMKRAGYPCRVTVSLKDSNITGLRQESVITTDSLATIEPKLIEMKIGEMPDMIQVDQALRTTLAL